MPKIVQHSRHSRTMFCVSVQTLQLSLPNKPARQCLLCVTPIKSQAYMLVLTCSTWTQQAGKCSCRHVQASRYPGVPYKLFPSSNRNYTCLYRAGVDKQMVMERTGHHSLEGVWTYKQTSKQQCAAISDILNLKKQCLESSGPTQQRNSLSLNDTYQYFQDTAHAFNFNVSWCGTVNIITSYH